MVSPRWFVLEVVGAFGGTLGTRVGGGVALVGGGSVGGLLKALAGGDLKLGLGDLIGTLDFGASVRAAGAISCSWDGLGCRAPLGVS